MACGEGYGADVLARARGRGRRRRRQPRGVRARAAALPARRTCASSATSSRRSPSRATRSCSCRRSSTSRTPARCSSTSRSQLRPGGVAYVSTPNVLTLAPRGRRALRQPVARQGVPRRGVPRAVRGALRRRSSCSASSTRASCASTSSRSSALGWDAVHARLGITKRFYDRFMPAISVARLRAARRRRPRPARSTSSPSAGRDGREGELALVLHTHMPYVEGFGTWPFGEEWLWEAMATSYLPLLDVLDARRAADAVADAGAVRPARGARASRERFAAFLRDVRRDVAPARHRRGAARGPTTTLAAELERAAGDYERGARALRARSAATCSARWRRTRRGRHRRRTPCCRCSPPTPACGCRCAAGIEAHRAAAPARLGAAASGCPSARTRRGSTRCSRRPACTRRASTSPTSSATATPPPAAAALARRAAARADRPRDRSSSSGATTAIPSRGAYRDYARTAPSTSTGRGRTTARSTTPRARGAQARADAARLRRPARATRVAGGGLCVCALDTELLGHWWHEGVAWLGRVVEEAGRAGLRARAPRRRARGATSRRRRRRRAAGDDAGARRATCRRGTRPAVADLALAGARAPSCASCRGPGARRRARVRELLALQAQRLGLPGDPRHGGRLPARARAARAPPRRSTRRWRLPDAASPRCATSRRGWTPAALVSP